MSPTLGRGAASGQRHPAARGVRRKLWYGVTNSIVAAWLVAALVVMISQRGIPAADWLGVHLTLLGAASTAIIIWSQHFADTLLRRGAGAGRVGLSIRLGVHTAGAIAVVVVVIIASVWPLVVVGGALVLGAAIAQATSLTLQVRAALPSRFGTLVRYYIVAALMLVIGVVLGVLMAETGATGEDHDRLYLAHIGFNLAGWVGLTVVGTIVLLWPTVLHARILPTADAAARRALPMLAFGVLIIGLACLIGLRWGVVLGLALYLAGLALVLIEAGRQAVKSPPTTYAGWSMGAALLWFFGSVLTFAVLVAVAPNWADAAAGLPALLIPLVVGFVAQLVFAALSYLIPVVIGGGPVATRCMNYEVDRFGVFRVIVVNGALLVGLLPLPVPVEITLMAIVAVALLTVIPLAVRAAVVSRHAKAEDWPVTSPKSAKPTLHTRSGTMMSAIGTLVLAVAVGVAFSPAGTLGPTGAASGGGSGAGNGAAAGTSSVVATGQTTTVKMSMKDMRFSPSSVRVPAGNKLIIDLTNADDMVHDLTLATGVTSGRMVGGASAKVDVGVITADIAGWCSITGHRQLGMVMNIVAIGAPSATDSSSASGGHDGMDMGAATGPSAAKDIDLAKKPPASFQPYDAALKPAATATAPGGTVHTLTLTVRDTLTQVAPGVYQTLWTYNGTAPGPTLRGHVGDRFEITLVNDASMGHSIDFHAGALAPDKPMRTIQPGQSLHYTFTATRSGIWLYHCSTMPMSAHIANGMFGAVIIDPPGLDAVSAEYVLVQSEYYLGPQKGEVDAAKVATEKPDLVVFNGYANQYSYRPLTAKAGEKVRIWVLDAGPNLFSAFHIVGAQFDTVYSEGDYLLRNGGSTGTGGSQVLGLLPAQGGFVELTFPEAGNYPFVTHAMSDAERGASGTFAVSK
ncbi:multicopper oxidase domain-containing protein [Rathayibacter soli]|uniref:multicopper oxidase domain-containing protein n=1 Tax=Rathayibacter soli TaxID=3144168 RepID=UPI0027E4D138|nr:multicopper oxidase domain-containing protein [Glaciibacter superstes]